MGELDGSPHRRWRDGYDFLKDLPDATQHGEHQRDECSAEQWDTAVSYINNNNQSKIKLRLYGTGQTVLLICEQVFWFTMW